MEDTMKVGIDSYCYHRFFGELYPDQKPPVKKMTMEGFLASAKELDADGVSLESCFFPTFDEGWLKELKAKLDDYGFDRVFAWGNPDGVERDIDFTADEILQLLDNVNSPYLGLNFDTGNFLRLLDDPVAGMAKLAPYVYATHVKDLYPHKNL